MKLISTTRSRFAGASLLAFCSMHALASDYPTTVQSFSPLGYWRLDETAAAPAVNKVANSGSLGSAGDGIIVLDVDKGQPGAVGTSIRLHNTGNAAGYCASKVDVPWNVALNPAPPFSVEFWVKPNALGSDGTGFCPLSSMNPNWYGGANRSGYLFYINNNGRYEFRLGTVGGYAGVLQSPNSSAVAGTWQHVVGTYDGATLRLYLNGVLAGTTNASVANWTRNNQMALRFGGTALPGTLSDQPWVSAAGISGNRGFDGWMDEVAVYQTLLSPSQAAAHFQAATTNAGGYSAQIIADGPVGYWPLNEPAATPPDPSTLPIISNSGSVGAAGNGTNLWGTLTAQTGSGYAGLGVANKAALFNGEKGGIQILDAPGLHVSGQITMMAWVKPSVKDNFRNVLAHGWDGDYKETFLRISRGPGPTGYGDDGKNYYEVGVTDGGANSYYDAALFEIPPGDIGNWVHLVGTYDGANWNLYRNGVLAASLPSVNPALDVTNRWAIGSRTDDSADALHFEIESLNFGGSIDEVALFGTALSAGNINTIYNSAQVPPVITRAVVNPGTVFKGAGGSFDVWAEGSPTLSYLWTSNGVSTGVTTTNFSVGSFAVSTPTIAVIVSNPYGSTTSSVSFAVVAAPPSFPVQPKAITRYNGRPFTFSATVSGSTPMSLQWKTNGVAIPGAITNTYSGIASASVAFNYTLSASNEAGIVDSATVPLTVLPIPGGYAGAVLANGPVSYWRLGETSGSVAHDNWSGVDGTYYAATLGQPGYSAIDSDTAVTFSGVENSYVGDISGTSINFQGHTNFTLEAWANGVAGQSDESTLIAKGAGASGTTATEQFSLDVASAVYRFYTRGNGNSLFEADATVGPNGTWQHVVGVYDDIGGAISLYVNGELQGSGTPRGAGLRVSSAVVSIGSKHLGNNPGFDGAFNGTIDEVAVYSNALSSSTVLAHYAAAYGPSLPPNISLQPVSTTNYVGLAANLSVGAYGTVPLAFQWKKGITPLSDGGSISGASSAELTIKPLVLGDSGTYSVTINNVNGTTNSVVVSLTVLPAPASPPAIPGLVAHLTFDNTLADATGRGNSGTSIHRTVTTSNVEPATYTAGMLGQAFSYSSDMGPPLSTGGTGAAITTNNFYATLGVRPDFQIGANAPFTVAFWIKLPLNYTLGDLPFFTTTIGSTFGAGIVFAPSFGPDAVAAEGTNPGGWAASFYGTGGGGVGYYGDIGSINDGEWHHLVHVNDRVNLLTYLDGNLAHARKQAGTSSAGAGAADTGTFANIGQDPDGTYGESGSGEIDDFGFFRRALSPLEAASIYVAGKTSGLSFSGAPITLTMEKVGNNLRLSWPAGTLQSTTSINGLWTDVTPVSPLTVNPATAGAVKFYRVRL